MKNISCGIPKACSRLMPDSPEPGVRSKYSSSHEQKNRDAFPQKKKEFQTVIPIRLRRTRRTTPITPPRAQMITVAHEMGRSVPPM
jgi:hypothetical protein